MKELKIEAKVENLETVMDFVNDQLECFHCPIKIQTQIDVAVDEIFSNIAHYAYTPDTGDASILVQKTAMPDAILITFKDSGKPYDPLKKNDPDITLSVAERQIGGLGIYLVKKTMDEIFYEYKDGQNLLSIKKYLPGKMHS